VDELEQIKKEIIKAILPWLMVGGVAVGGVGGSGVLRVDKFGESDAKLLKQEIIFEMQKMELSIRKDMPPICTKKRILNIEEFLEHKYPDFHRSEFCW